MTAAAYATNLVEIIGDTQTNATTNWTALGGGAAGLNAGETDYYIEDSQCLTKNAFASATKGMIYDTGADQGGSGTDGAYSVWCTHLTPNSLDTIAGGGIQFLIGSSTSDYAHYYIAGSDTIEFGGWVFGAVKEQTTGDQADTGTPSATVEQTFGVLFDLPAGGPTKGAPNAIDTVREGRHDIVITNGTAPDAAADFDGVISNLETSTLRWGLMAQRVPGGAFEQSGLIQFGTSGTQVRFTDSNKTINLRDHPHVTSGFHAWEINNASSVVTWDAITVKALGTTSTGSLTINNNATLTATGCSFIDMGAFTLGGSNTSMAACTWQNCGLITLAESDISTSSILLSAVAADEGAIYDNRTTTGATSITELDNCTISKGTNAHHAIRFGANVDDDITLTGIEFTGFSSTADANDSTLRFDATAGTMNVNLVNCTVDGNPATTSNIGVDDAAGITVTLVVDPKTTKITCVDQSGATIASARVLLETSDNGGGSGFPYRASVSITQAAGTATVSHTGHGLVTGDYVVIRGAQPDGYNKQAQITVTGANAYTYSVDSGLSSPATGSPVSSYAAISGLTNGSGVIQSSKTWPASQGLTGWARKSTTSPFFKPGPITITDASGGSDVTVQMISDE